MTDYVKHRSVVLVAVVVLSGCSSFAPTRWSVGDKAQPADNNPIVDIVCLWEPTEGHDELGRPARGVQGQIMFFPRQGDLPVVAHGSAQILQFDDFGPRDQWTTPIKQIDLTPAQWNAHLHNGMLGKTYSVFIPYARSHPYQVNLSLQVKWTPVSTGKPIFSKIAHVTLPGPPRERRESAVIEDIVRKRDRSSSGYRDIVAESLGSVKVNEPTPNPRFRTIHRWNEPAVAASVAPSESGTVQQASAEIPAETPTTPSRRFRLTAPPAE